ncbi:MAG: hypothetical protein A2Y92_00690 [Chloroflexi bacterium RBG_13_57_8]|nr:MAG: hypothetical protein A2Y92_00690 [Chloroflexi bacterium RBG_13_57_8]
MGEPDWEMTATTVYCDVVDEEVTLLVYAGGTARCTGREKNSGPGKKKNRTEKSPGGGCSEECTALKRYRDSLLKNQKTS